MFLEPTGLVLSRAPGGGHPLYYAHLPEGGVLVCTRLEPLSRITGARVSPSAAAHLLAKWSESGSAFPSPLEGISCLSTNERIHVDSAGGTRRSACMSPEGDLAGCSTGEAVTELWTQVCAAVRRAAGDAERIAVLLSGGLDSSGLLAALLREGRRVMPITLDFEGPGDDRPHVRALEEAFGLEVVRIAPLEARDFWREVLVVDAAPFLNVSGPFELLFSRKAAALGADLLLTGAAGDDVFSGDLRAYAAEFRERPLATAISVLGLELPWSVGALRRLQHYVIEPLLGGTPLAEPLRRRRARRLMDRFPFAGPGLKSVLVQAGADSVDAREPPTSTAERFSWIAEGAWVSEAAERRSQIEILTGVRRRDPFLDPELLAFVAKLPVSMLQRGGWYRGLYRSALAGRLPESVRMRRDKGDIGPAIFALIEAQGGVDAFSELLSMEATGALGLIHPPAFLRWAVRLRERSALGLDEAAILFRALSLEAFARGYS